MNVTTEANAEGAITDAARLANVDGAVVRVRLDCPDDLEVDEKLVTTKLTELGAQHVLRVQRQQRTEVTAAVEGLDASLEMYEVVDLYFAGQKRAATRVKLARAIIDEVDGGVS